MKCSPMPPRKHPMRRGKALSRSAKRLSTPKPTPDRGEEEKRFMRQFRGLPCVICKRTSFLKDEKGNPILSAGHHLLEKSTHPEHRLNPDNIVPLCGKCHGIAHEYPDKFLLLLCVYANETYLWLMEHRHHRKTE